MDPFNSNNQVNSMYQPPVQQNQGHKTSVVAILVFVIIAVLVAVLGFGRIHNMKEEDAKAAAEQARQAQITANKNAAMKAQAAKLSEDNILKELNAIDSASNTEAIKAIESAF